MTAAAQHTTRTGWRDPKEIVGHEVWEREIELMMRDHPFDRIMAERVFGQAVAYLVTAFENRGRARELGPGPIVDIGVHTFILDTRNYAAFCQRVGGEFLHHVPEVEFKNDGTVGRTAEAIAEAGFPVDWALWEADAGKCSPCHPGNDSH